MHLGWWPVGLSAVICWNAALAAGAITQPAVMEGPAAASLDTPAPLAAPLPLPSATLAAGTTVFVRLDADLSATTAKPGDPFPIVVERDVVDRDTIVIPRGTPGTGEVTFTTGNGGFGKAGIIGIALRHLELGDRQVALVGRYREEGANKNGAAAVTMFAAGILSALVKGKPGAIPRDRELKARTGEDIAFTPHSGDAVVEETISGEETKAPADDPTAAPETVPSTGEPT